MFIFVTLPSGCLKKECQISHHRFYYSPIQGFIKLCIIEFDLLKLPKSITIGFRSSVRQTLAVFRSRCASGSGVNSCRYLTASQTWQNNRKISATCRSELVRDLMLRQSCSVPLPQYGSTMQTSDVAFMTISAEPIYDIQILPKIVYLYTYIYIYIYT